MELPSANSLFFFISRYPMNFQVYTSYIETLFTLKKCYKLKLSIGFTRDKIKVCKKCKFKAHSQKYWYTTRSTQKNKPDIQLLYFCNGNLTKSMNLICLLLNVYTTREHQKTTNYVEFKEKKRLNVHSKTLTCTETYFFLDLKRQQQL